MALSVVTTVVLTLTTMLSDMANRWVLVPLELTYLRTVTFIVLIAMVAPLAKWYLDNKNSQLCSHLGPFPLTIITNSIVLGVSVQNSAEGINFIPSILHGLGAGLGFSLVLILFAAMWQRLAVADVPQPFQGAAIGMISLGLMSLAFMGFGGLV